jgi:AraC family transcriptional regulator
MQADITQLYNSSICSVHNFICRCEACSASKNEYQEEFVIAYIRKGNFQFNIFRAELDAYHGLFLINKPGYEYHVGHAHNIPDECTIFSLRASTLSALQEQATAFDWFFNNPDRQSILIRATPQTEYLHHCILRLLRTPNYPKLWTDTLIADLLMQVLSSSSLHTPSFTVKQKKNYMPVVEKIKGYINENFAEDISLPQLADLGNMSVFHFNRLFKKITGYTPYNYLLSVRLQLAQLHIKNTSEPVTQIAFSSGFKSLEHFSASYKDFFGRSPSQDRV